jgi:hypothetical protein
LGLAQRESGRKQKTKKRPPDSPLTFNSADSANVPPRLLSVAPGKSPPSHSISCPGLTRNLVKKKKKMSRKCAGCKKWLVPGQFTCPFCKRGEEEQKTDVKEENIKKLRLLFADKSELQESEALLLFVAFLPSDVVPEVSWGVIFSKKKKQKCFFFFFFSRICWTSAFCMVRAPSCSTS